MVRQPLSRAGTGLRARSHRLAATLAACIALASCGGSDDAPAPPATEPIVAAPDALTLSAGGSGELLANDTIGAATASAVNVIFSVTSSPVPAGLSFSDGGRVTVGAAAASATSDLGYRICQRSLPTHCADATARIVVLGSAVVTGKVVDSATGAAIAGATVEAAGRSAVTDAFGGYVLQGVAGAARAALRFTAGGHAANVRVAAVRGDADTDVQARLLPVASTRTLAVATGGNAGVADTAALLALPATALQRGDGTAAAGNATIFLTPISPAVDPAQMPGDFTTTGAGGADIPIESFGALDLALQDDAGTALGLRGGMAATVHIPLASRNPSPPATAPLFALDAASGRWVQEGSATLGSSGGLRYYEGRIGHFGTWSVGQAIDPATTLSGCVVDAGGAPVAGAGVVGDGIDYSSARSVTTDAAGRFALVLRRGGAAAVAASSNRRPTNTLVADPSLTGTASSTLPECLKLGSGGADIALKLNWERLPADLDIHLYTPSGDNVAFGSRGAPAAAPFAHLDVDDLDGHGPEVVTVTRLMVGTYFFSVNNFSGAAEGSFGSAQARVELSLPGQPPELFTALSAGGTPLANWWNVLAFSVDGACKVTLQRTNVIATAPPSGQAPPGTPPVYCTPQSP